MLKGFVIIETKFQTKKEIIDFAKKIWKGYHRDFIESIYVYSDNGILKIVIITKHCTGTSSIKEEIIGIYKNEIISIQMLLAVDEVFPSQD